LFVADWREIGLRSRKKGFDSTAESKKFGYNEYFPLKNLAKGTELSNFEMSAIYTDYLTTYIKLINSWVANADLTKFILYVVKRLR